MTFKIVLIILASLAYDQIHVCQLVIICVNIGSFEKVLKKILPFMGEKTLVMDILSTKKKVIEISESILGDRAARFYPCLGSARL